MNYCIPTYFLAFLPLTALVYQAAPQRHRWKILLAASWSFFWSISSKLIVYLLFSIVSIHRFGLWMDKILRERSEAVKAVPRPERKAVKEQYAKKLYRILCVGIFLQLGILLVLKYTGFFCENLGAVLRLLCCPFALPVPRFALPIGISFYTMQAMSYLFDVYYGRIEADKNLARIALYMSFFPGLMEGPICRWSETAAQLWDGKSITYQNLTFGAQRILWGLAKKYIMADRLDLLVKTVFSGYQDYDGGVIALSMLCYTCQLYMEFSGTMDVVIGSAEVFGVKMPENFRQPFFSKTISEFWTRWHISLGAWFRDYIFYPVSLSAPMKTVAKNGRKRFGNHFGPLCASSVALFCVWVCNGLWHGSAWNYLFFGIYHFVLILTGNIIDPFTAGWLAKLHIDKQGKLWKAVQIARTIVLVNIGELFFRADGLAAGFSMFHIMVTRFTLRSFANGAFLTLGMDGFDFIVIFMGIAVMLCVSLLREQNISVREELAKMSTVKRWLILYAMLLLVIIFGAYGMNYAPVDPIYAGF